MKDDPQGGTVLSGTAVKEVAGLAEQAATVQVVERDGVAFTNWPMQRLNDDPPMPTALQFTTLDALAQYVQVEEPEPSDLVVHVVSPTVVEVVSLLEGKHGHRRRCIARAHALIGPMQGFAFDERFSLEDVNIALQTCFDPELGHVQELRQFCASVKSTEDLTVADDGVSQEVQARAGIVAVAGVKVRNPWLLAPFRTFPDIAQPTSPFVLRFFKSDRGPVAGLYNTGNAEWYIEAIREIAACLREKLGARWVVLG